MRENTKPRWQPGQRTEHSTDKRIISLPLPAVNTQFPFTDQRGRVPRLEEPTSYLLCEAIQPGPGEFESQQGYHSAWNQREIIALKAKIARKNRRD